LSLQKPNFVGQVLFLTILAVRSSIANGAVGRKR
jgi:hypothetical protein